MFTPFYHTEQYSSVYVFSKQNDMLIFAKDVRTK